MQRDGTFLPYEHPLQFAVGIKGEAVTRATVDNVWGPNTITVQSIDNYDEENTSPSWSEAVTGYYAAIPALSSTTIVSGSSDYWQAIDEIKLIRAWCYGDDEFRRPLPNENNGWQVAVNQNEGNNYANSDFIYARTTATYKIYEKVMLSFDWAPMVGGTRKFDPVQLIITVTNGGEWAADKRFITRPEICAECSFIHEIVLENKEPIVLDAKNNKYVGPEGYFTIVIDKMNGDTVEAWHVENAKTKTENLAGRAKGKHIDLVIGAACRSTGHFFSRVYAQLYKEALGVK